MTLSSESRSELIEWCLKQKLGEFAEWEKPILGHTVGPGDPCAYDNFAALLNDTRAAIFSQLTDLPDQELMALKTQNSDVDKKVAARWRSCFEDDLNLLRRLLPPYAEAGFGHPYYRADFEYWGLSMAPEYPAIRAP